MFRENLIRGRGLLCRSLMKSQLASQAYSPVYAALVAVINTKLPEIGELLLHRLLLQFKRSYRRNDKPVCAAALSFLAHLTNQGVVHEVLILEILALLLEAPTDDSVELAVTLTKEAGATMQDVARQALAAVLDRFRAVLHEGSIGEGGVGWWGEGLCCTRGRLVRWGGRISVCVGGEWWAGGGRVRWWGALLGSTCN